MTCNRVRSSLSDHLDGRLSGRQRQELSRHVYECAECSRHLSAYAQLRQELRSLPQSEVPAHLTVRLQELAVQEGARRQAQLSTVTWFRVWLDSFHLWMDNLMKPLAIPLAGGLASAFVLFSMLAPTFTLPARPTVEEDVPTALYSVASMDMLGPFGMVDDMIILDVTVDDQGRMVEYTSPNNSPVLNDPQMRRIIENNLLFSRFTPANLFGQPVTGKVRIALRRSQVDVKG